MIGDRTDPGSDETHHGVADGLAHAPHLPIPPFVDGESNHVRSNSHHLGGCGRSIIEVHPVTQPTQRSPRRCAGHLGEILLFHTEGWVGEAMGEIPVVGDQDETFCVHVETTDRKDPWRVRDELDHRGSPLGVVSGGHHSPWLVAEVMHVPRGGGDDHAIDCDLYR